MPGPMPPVETLVIEDASDEYEFMQYFANPSVPHVFYRHWGRASVDQPYLVTDQHVYSVQNVRRLHEFLGRFLEDVG